MKLTANHYEQANEGKALFLPCRQQISAIRAATKQALLHHCSEIPYVITRRIDIYPRRIDDLLTDREALDKIILEHHACLSDFNKDAICCAVLWDSQGAEGLLLHLEEDALLCAYLPLMTRAYAIHENECSAMLMHLAASMDDISIFIDQPIASGHWSMGELLAYLSAYIN